MSDAFVGEHMVKFPFVAHPEMSVKAASELMNSCSIRHLPVLEDGELIGLVSERDLRPFLSKAPQAPVREMMVENPYCVSVGTSLEEVVETMEKKKIGSAVVVSPQNHVVGIFTTTDALRVLKNMLKEDPHATWRIRSIEEFFVPWEEQAV